MKLSGIAVIVIFVLGGGVRLLDVSRPIDKASWRECDEGSISRNFLREGFDPLYPRVDWRGDGPGYAEMEFPAYPWLIGLTYELTGIHDNAGRVWSFVFSLATLFFFFRLAREYLDPWPAVVALAFFAFNPLNVEIGTSIQPEGLMMMAYVAAAYFFVRWLRTEAVIDICSASLATMIALLGKASAAHIGIFFAVLLLKKYGIGAIRQPGVWLLGLMSLVPSVEWYSHARQLWLTYGNSLGVSNEYHWIGPDFFTDGSFIAGIFRSELVYVWSYAGILIGLFALVFAWRERAALDGMLWFAAVFTFYVVTARTSGDDWAYYYHIFSVVPAALLVGAAVNRIMSWSSEGADGLGEGLLASRLVSACIIGVLLAATFLMDVRSAHAKYLDEHSHAPEYTFAADLRSKLTSPGLIVASGGHCVDEKGYPVAYNASYMFYWLDRKGWNMCVEQQSPELLKAYKRRGAVYFVAEQRYLHLTPGMEAAAKATYPVVAQSDEVIVFDLTAGKQE